jgi:predicted anti-sigma-YlaC factor YlaD
MTHIDLETLSAFVDGVTDDAASIRAHVNACANCRTQVEQLQALNAMLALDVDREPSAAFDERVFAAIAAEKPSLATRLRLRFLAPVLAASVAAGVLFVVFDGEPSEDELFMAEHQEMLAELDLIRDLPSVEDAGSDFAIIEEMEGE